MVLVAGWGGECGPKVSGPLTLEVGLVLTWFLCNQGPFCGGQSGLHCHPHCYCLGKQLNCQGVAAVQSGSATPMIYISSMTHVFLKALEPSPLLSLYIPIGAISPETF